MSRNITIVQLEGAINRCKSERPFFNGVLPGDMRLLADLYGEMIYRRLDSVAVESLSPALLAVLGAWIDAAAVEPGAAPAGTCGTSADPGADDCEACQ
ncbi:MAG: DUF3717 domain-containing protein [Kiritimatiellae bacterium]|nr:DUF3717 domain-containing protein [Kiritimatiellia bacterium]